MTKISRSNFTSGIVALGDLLRTRSRVVHTEKWQGTDISAKPEMATHELLDVSLTVPIWTEALATLQADIKPNLPWADDHFLERVCGMPLNPGETWRSWPYAHSADKFRKNEMFDHNYMERYWPKFARMTEGGKLLFQDGEVYRPEEIAELGEDDPMPCPLTTKKNSHCGIGLMDYGDLSDVIDLLYEQPLTRQAYMPIWHPDDTGVRHGGRVPCTLGYHFIVRQSKLHIIYPIRSCDFVRHFRDDVYLTVRLVLWVLGKLRERDAKWLEVMPGQFTMHITSLHCFRNDWRLLFGDAPVPA